MEFILSLHGGWRKCLQLPEAFAELAAESSVWVTWIQSEGCPNGPTRPETELSSEERLFLVKGWRSFLQAHEVEPGYVTQFRFDGLGTFFIKFFDCTHCHAACCPEGDTSEDPVPDSDSKEHEIPEWP